MGQWGFKTRDVSAQADHSQSNIEMQGLGQEVITYVDLKEIFK